MSHLSNVWFKVTGLQVTHGRGCRVTTTSGDEYLDFAAGIAVNSTGHAHPRVAAAIAAQAERFIHAQINVFTHDLAEPLAAKLDEITPAGIDTFFFANSGAEITEAAVKLAKQATKRPNVIVFQGSFHGRTHMAMAMTTSKTGYRAGHAPLPAGVYVSPFPDPLAADQEATVAAALTAFDRLLLAETAPSETAAVIMEPVLGEGGYVPAPKAFIEGVAQRCKQHGILFIADEVQSGFGRTGNWFAVEQYEIEPDIICMAKGIASGFPFSALGTRRELDDLWPKGSHGGTYGGNPLGCAAALATIEVMSEPGFMDNVRARGEQLSNALRALADPGVLQVRGPGLMVGTVFDDPGRVPKLLEHCLNEGHLILMNAGTYGNVIRWMPPLVVTADEIDEGVQAFTNALKATA
jgi:4-aminobutyrate aminotransferase